MTKPRKPSQPAAQQPSIQPSTQLRPSRRDFLAGRAVLSEVEHVAGQTGDAFVNGLRTDQRDMQQQPLFRSGETIRLETRAMACHFSVVLNPGEQGRVWVASDALDLVHELEQQLTAYRSDSELSQLNRAAAIEPVVAHSRLFGLLKTCRELAELTEGAFDPTSGPLIALWRHCREAGRVPTETEIEGCLARTGMSHVSLDDAAETVCFDRVGVELNAGGIGKGFALDEAARQLVENGMTGFLMHGGHSSLLANGGHFGQPGWPVGIGNPLFTERRLGTILLKDQALSTSGSNIQFFRLEGRRYGHILDPKTGWPVEGTLSVTVVADSAAVADALSTAIFVAGVEIARRCCDTLPSVGAILILFPERGRRVRPMVIGIPPEQLSWDLEQVDGEFLMDQTS